jgi:MYXO-CTERM domain-containing protein
VLQRFLKRRSFAALGGWLILTGCGDLRSGENPQLERAAIVNGERSTAADDAVVNVVSRPTGSAAQSCTGTLVAPNIVLTALHCVAQFSGGNFGCTPDGTLSAEHAGDGALGELARPEQVEIRIGVYPATAPDAYGAKLFGTGSNQICANDFAIVVLDRDLNLPLRAMRLERGVDLGEAIRVVGYGATESSSTVGRFARENLTVIDRGQDAGGSATNDAAPRTLVVGQGPCHGDSGGPAFSQATSALVGVYSLVSGASCTAVGVRNVYTRLEPFADLVNSAFAYASQAPVLEGAENGSAGEAGEAGSAGSSSSSAGSGGVESGGASNTSGAADTASGGLQRPAGSGSRQDANCGCRAARSAPSWPLGLAASVAALALLRRRRRTLRAS